MGEKDDYDSENSWGRLLRFFLRRNKLVAIVDRGHPWSARGNITPGPLFFIVWMLRSVRHGSFVSGHWESGS